jgi:hypothetical protein
MGFCKSPWREERKTAADKWEFGRDPPRFESFNPPLISLSTHSKAWKSEYITIKCMLSLWWGHE